MISHKIYSNSNRRFQGAGAELHCLSTSPESLMNKSVSPPPPPPPLLKESSIDSNYDPIISNVTKAIIPLSTPIIRPNAPSVLRSNFHGHGGPIWTVDYNEETNQLFSGSYDQTIKVRNCRQFSYF